MLRRIIPSQVNGRVKAPSSKSYAQRALIAAMLSEGVSTIEPVELCEDSEAVIEAIQELGAVVEKDDAGRYTIKGALYSKDENDSYIIQGVATQLGNPISTGQREINIGESGLAARLLAPIVALFPGETTIAGRGSILTRPMIEIQQSLTELGVQLNDNGGYLPLQINGGLVGGEVEIDGTRGSQFISGLLMALPLAKQDSILHVRNLKSQPYIDMTIKLLKDFGITVNHDNYQTFYISGNQRYHATTYHVEGDWSGAAPLLVAGAVAGEVTVERLNLQSLQPDRAIIEVLRAVGADVLESGVEVTVRRNRLDAFRFDATHTPDLFPPLVALAANCSGMSTIIGTQRLLYKESNRAETLCREFRKLGVRVDISQPNIMTIQGGGFPDLCGLEREGNDIEIKSCGKVTAERDHPINEQPFDMTREILVKSHNDHRIAMALAIGALNAPESTIIGNAEAVNKSYPNFWKDFDNLTGNNSNPQ